MRETSEPLHALRLVLRTQPRSDWPTCVKVHSPNNKFSGQCPILNQASGENGDLHYALQKQDAQTIGCKWSDISLPQRGYVLQPRVGPPRAYPGYAWLQGTYPNGVMAKESPVGHNPFRLEGHFWGNANPG